MPNQPKAAAAAAVAAAPSNVTPGSVATVDPFDIDSTSRPSDGKTAPAAKTAPRKERCDGHTDTSNGNWRKLGAGRGHDTGNFDGSSGSEVDSSDDSSDDANQALTQTPPVDKPATKPFYKQPCSGGCRWRRGGSHHHRNCRRRFPKQQHSSDGSLPNQVAQRESSCAATRLSVVCWPRLCSRSCRISAAGAQTTWSSLQ